jgi:plasmid stabilization system protein ParE
VDGRSPPLPAGIQRFIAQDSAFYAEWVVARVIDRVEAVARHPGRGHPVHEYPEAPLREVHEASYRIIYHVREDTLHVVTIVHFKQMLKPGRVRGV